MPIEGGGEDAYRGGGEDAYRGGWGGCQHCCGRRSIKTIYVEMFER